MFKRLTIRQEGPSKANRWLRRAGWIGLGAAGSIFALVGVASFPLSSLLVRPRLKRLSQLKRPHIKNLLRRLGIQVQDVSITSFDSTTLKGWWMEASKEAPTIVILHGVKQNRTDVLRAALVLRREGFNVLMFDGRAHGDSGGRYVTYGVFERRDSPSGSGRQPMGKGDLGREPVCIAQADRCRVRQPNHASAAERLEPAALDDHTGR